VIRTIRLDSRYELRIGPVVHGPAAPGVRLDLWSLSGGPPARDTGSYVIVPTPLVDKLACALGAAAAESMIGPLFTPVAEAKQ
jgi:hypothetical protein